MFQSYLNKIELLKRAAALKPVIIHFDSRMDVQLFTSSNPGLKSVKLVPWLPNQLTKLSANGIYLCHNSFRVVKDGDKLFLSNRPSDFEFSCDVLYVHAESAFPTRMMVSSVTLDFSGLPVHNYRRYHLHFTDWGVNSDAFNTLWRFFKSLKYCGDHHSQYDYSLDVWCKCGAYAPCIVLGHGEDITILPFETIECVFDSNYTGVLRTKRLSSLVLPRDFFSTCEKLNINYACVIECLGRMSQIFQFTFCHEDL